MKHDVTPTEVEEVMASDSIVVRQTYKNRLQVTGLTFHGRVLAVVIGPAPDNPRVYYTFSARPASRKERRFYQEQREP
ncbi:MAG: BrnT family toxin [Chloroflexia bacterium]|nr:BrnT family toxin [Chloroflexia bacterium]